MSTRLALSSCLLLLGACDVSNGDSDGSIERDSAVSDGGGLLDGGPADAGAATDAATDAGGWLCDVSACDPRDRSSCEPGFCSLAGGEPECDDVTTPGTLGAEVACTATEECNPGLACFMASTGAAGVCARPCCPGEAMGCAVGSRCGGSGLLADGTATAWGRCLSIRSCDPLRPAVACEAREACYLIDGSLMTECRIAGTRGAGDSCRVQEDCEGGIAASLHCIRLCAVMADSCPTAEGRCVQQAHTPSGVGLCTLDAMSARNSDR